MNINSRITGTMVLKHTNGFSLNFSSSQSYEVVPLVVTEDGLSTGFIQEIVHIQEHCVGRYVGRPVQATAHRLSPGQT
jgi:hypothetical protein